MQMLQIIQSSDFYRTWTQSKRGTLAMPKRIAEALSGKSVEFPRIPSGSTPVLVGAYVIP